MKIEKNAKDLMTPIERKKAIQNGEMADREEISEAETSDPAGICAEIGKQESSAGRVCQKRDKSQFSQDRFSGQNDS